MDPVSAVVFESIQEDRKKKDAAREERIKEMEKRLQVKLPVVEATVKKTPEESANEMQRRLNIDDDQRIFFRKDISGNILKMPLEQSPEDFVKDITFSSSFSSDETVDVQYVNRIEEYKEEYKQISEEEQKNLWTTKLSELQKLQKEQQERKENIIGTAEDGEQLPLEYICNGIVPATNHSPATLNSMKWQIKTSAETDIYKLRNINEFTPPFETKTVWPCEACKKPFTTKASLQRHIERKAGCKTMKENNVDDSILENNNEPIAEWIDGILKKSISGDAENPLCKGCDIEFANKSNLMKHLTKSPACNKLAKLAFLKYVYDGIDKKKLPNNLSDCDASGCMIA